MSVVGSLGYSNGTNGVGGSIPGNQGVVLGMGVSPILGDARSQIIGSMGNIVSGGNSGRNMSFGEVAGAVDAKGPSDLFAKEVHVKGYSSKHKEKGVVELFTWNQEVMTRNSVNIKETGVTISRSFGCAPAHIEETVVGKVGKDNNQQLLATHLDQ